MYSDSILDNDMQPANPLHAHPTYTNSEPACRTAVVWITTQIGVGENCTEIRRRGPGIGERHIDPVPLGYHSRALGRVSVSFPRVIDKTTEHADDISDVRARGDGEIEQLPNQLAIRDGLHA